MRSIKQKNQKLILQAITELAKGGEPININRVSKKTGITWKTVRKYFLNNFYI